MTIKKRQQLLAVVAIAVVALFAGDKLVFTPLVESYRKRAQRIADLRKQVTQGDQLLLRERTIRSRWEYMQTNTLPNNASLCEQQLFQAVDLWSQWSRIGITAITPQWKRDADDFITLECRVDALGNLPAVSRFLYEIERDPQALKIESVEISSRDTSGQLLSLGLQFSGLVLTPPAQ